MNTCANLLLLCKWFTENRFKSAFIEFSDALGAFQADE